MDLVILVALIKEQQFEMKYYNIQLPSVWRLQWIRTGNDTIWISSSCFQTYSSNASWSVWNQDQCLVSWMVNISEEHWSDLSHTTKHGELQRLKRHGEWNPWGFSNIYMYIYMNMFSFTIQALNITNKVIGSRLMFKFFSRSKQNILKLKLT